MAYKPFKMRGGPFKRNYGIGAESPAKHPTHGDHHGDPGNKEAIKKAAQEHFERHKEQHYPTKSDTTDTPTKHRDTDAEYEAMRKRPPMEQRIGGPGRGEVGHAHPHSGRSGAYSGTWTSQTDFVAKSENPKDIAYEKRKKSPLEQTKVIKETAHYKHPEPQPVLKDRISPRYQKQEYLQPNLPKLIAEKQHIIPDYHKVEGGRLISTTPQSLYHDPTYKKRTKTGKKLTKIANIFRSDKKDKPIGVKKKKSPMKQMLPNTSYQHFEAQDKGKKIARGVGKAAANMVKLAAAKKALSKLLKTKASEAGFEPGTMQGFKKD